MSWQQQEQQHYVAVVPANICVCLLPLPVSCVYVWVLLIVVPGVNHPLWAHSYLGYGFDVVQTKVDALVKQLAHANNASHHTSGTADHPTTAGAALGHDNASGAVEHSGARAHAAAAQPAASASAVHMGVDGLVDPCLPAGYHSEDGRVGSGVWQQCQQLVESVIDPSTCKPVNGKPCPEVPEHMPKLTGEGPQHLHLTAAAAAASQLLSTRMMMTTCVNVGGFGCVGLFGWQCLCRGKGHLSDVCTFGCSS